MLGFIIYIIIEYHIKLIFLKNQSDVLYFSLLVSMQYKKTTITGQININIEVHNDQCHTLTTIAKLHIKITIIRGKKLKSK